MLHVQQSLRHTVSNCGCCDRRWFDKVYDRIAEPQVQLEDLNAPLAQVNRR